MAWYDVTHRCAWQHRERYPDPERASVGDVEAETPAEAAGKFWDGENADYDDIIDVFEAADPDNGDATGAHIGAFRVTSRRVVDVAPYTPGE